MKGNEQLKEYGKRLRLYHLCNHMDELLHVAQQDKPTYHEFLMGLLEREITCREKKDGNYIHLYSITLVKGCKRILY